jgi:serpin B
MGTGCSKKSKSKSNIATLDQASGENAIYDQVASKSSKGKTSDEELKKAYSEFVVGMVNRCAADSGNENFMVSTDSVLFAMEMTAAGADGETLDQMLGTLMPGVDKEDALLFAADRMDQIKSSQLKIANSVWINEKSEPAFFSNYLKYVENNFDAKIDALPFDASGAGKINSWVNDNTDGMIPTLIDTLESEDLMVLVNALSFDAKWKKTI